MSAKPPRTFYKILLSSVILASALLTGSLGYLAYKANQDEPKVVATTTTQSHTTSYLDIAQPIAGVADSTQPGATKPASPAPQSSNNEDCYPLSNAGNCYEAGQYCRHSDEGDTGVAGNGEDIICEDNNGLRWEPN